MGVTILESVKIQAQVLVPLVKTLQSELGEEKANALVRKALGEHYRKLGNLFWQSEAERDLGKKMTLAFEDFAASNALDYEVMKKTTDEFQVNVTGCRYAEFYQQLGVPELGFLLVCSADLTMAEGYAANVQLARTQTIMQGASHCDFRYRLAQEKKTKESK
jgi:predicted ArsR family transcriptional regulator